MRCRTARRSLLAARDGELAAAEREALDAHLSGCEACRALAGETARLHRALAALPQRADVPPGLAEATLRRVRAEMADDAAPRGAWWWMAAPLAAGLAGVVVWHTWPAAVVTSQQQTAAQQPAASRTAEPAPAAPRQAASKAVPVPAASEAAPPVEPPPQVAQSLDLYLDMPILENMEKLQNYDAIRTVDVGEGQNGDDGRG